MIKTATVPTDRGAVRGGTKVFINVTHAAQVPGFRKRRDLSGSEAVEGLHVPIAIGPPRTDVDRAGKPCTVYDVVVNPEVTSGCVSRGGEAFRHMVCGIVMQNVEAKFGRKASPPWTLHEAYKLPTVANRYKGTLPPPAQWVRSPRKAGIETVDGSATDAAAAAGASTGDGGKTKARASASAMAVAGTTTSESVRAAMSVAEAAAAGAPVGPDGVVRVDMQVRRLGEEEEEAKARGARPMADLQSVAEDAEQGGGADDATSTSRSGLAAAERALSAPSSSAAKPRSATLIEEVGASRAGKVTPVDAGERVDEVSADLRERASRRVRARPSRPASTPVVSVQLHRVVPSTTAAGDIAAAGGGAAKEASVSAWWRSPTEATTSEWDPASWRGLPLPSSSPGQSRAAGCLEAGELVGVTVRLELDASHPDLLQALEKGLHAAGKATSRPHGSAACVAELCCSSHGHEAGADVLARLVQVSCGEESISLAAPGHVPTTVLLPAVVAPTGASCSVTARGTAPAAVSVQVWVPTTQWPAAFDADATTKADPGLSASRQTVLQAGSRVPSPHDLPAGSGRAPDAEAGFAEDRFHVKDPLSLHFLQERERAKAEAEQKQQAKEAAATNPAAAAQQTPAPTDYDLESEADIGLL